MSEHFVQDVADGIDAAGPSLSTHWHLPAVAQAVHSLLCRGQSTGVLLVDPAAATGEMTGALRVARLETAMPRSEMNRS
jgi:hypothetical protein